MLDNQLIKKAYQKLRYTEEQLQEFMKCAHPDTGPYYFMNNFVKVQHPVKGGMDFHPFKFQEGLIDVYHCNRKSIAMVSRQMGKSTVAAAYLLWYAMFIPDSLIIIASKTHSDAKEIMQKVRYAYEEIPDHIRAGCKKYNVESIEFDNNSRILAESTTENTGRGKAVSLIYLDEFAFVEPRMASALWKSLSPTLSTGGRIIITSTPNTDEDQFAELWAGAESILDDFGNEREDGLGINGFKPFKATWEAHPDRDENWAAEQLAELGQDGFDREHLCKFVTFDETLINGVKLLELNNKIKDPIRKSGEIRWFKEIQPNSIYVVSMDPSLGTGRDNSVIQVFELPSMVQVAEWMHNKTIIEKQIHILKELLEEISSHDDPEIYWTIENNTLGESGLVVIREIGEELFPGMFLHEPKRTQNRHMRKGFTTSNRSKLEACAKLKTWLETDKMTIFSRPLLSELKTFVAKGAGFEAKVGLKDDTVSATLLAIRMINIIATWEDTVHTSLSNQENTDWDDDDVAPLPIGFL